MNPADVGPEARVPAGPTLARINALVASGKSGAWIAHAIVCSSGHLDLGRDTVSRRNADAVENLAVEALKRARRNRGQVSVDRTTRAQHHAARDLGRLDQEWRDHAACRGQQTALFFPPPGGGAGVVSAEAVALCRSCPVRSQCLDYAMATQSVGIWAATTDEDRRRLHRRR